jgi:hypothetical protein
MNKLNSKKDAEEFNINTIELFYTDYEIIKYDEVKMKFYENRIQKNLELKIINSEKINILKDSLEPIIYLYFNNKKYIAKGLWVLSSSVPEECDYFFAIDDNGKIAFFKDNILSLIGFENK